VQGAINVTWEARVRFGENLVTLRSQEETGGHAQS
jgi:hypothetical protein